MASVQYTRLRSAFPDAGDDARRFQRAMLRSQAKPRLAPLSKPQRGSMPQP